MANIGSLTAFIGLDHKKLDKGLEHSKSAIQSFEAQFKKLESVVAGVGLSLGATHIFREVTKEGAEFFHLMETVAGVMRASEDDFKRVTKAAMDMEKRTTYAAKESGRAFYFLASAGFNAQQMISALPQVLRLASIGVIDIARAADIAVNTLRGFSMPVSDLQRVNDVLVGTFTRTNTTLEWMAESLTYATPIAANFGYTIEELAGMIGTLSMAGIRGSMAGTQIAMAMQQANEAALRLGYTSSDLVDVLAQMKKEGRTSQDVMDLFGQRAGRAALTLWRNLEFTRDLQATLRNVQGESTKLAARMRASVKSSLGRIKTMFGAIALDVFETYGADLKKLADDAHKWLNAHLHDIVQFVSLVTRAVLMGMQAIFATMKLIGEIGGGIKKILGITDPASQVAEAAHGIGEAAKHGAEAVSHQAEKAAHGFAEIGKAAEEGAGSVTREMRHAAGSVEDVAEVAKTGALAVEGHADAMRDALAAPDGADWRQFWQDRGAEAEATATQFEKTGRAMRAVASTQPEISGWERFMAVTVFIGDVSLALIVQALKSISALVFTVGKGIVDVFVQAARLLKDAWDGVIALATGNWSGALDAAKKLWSDWWGDLAQTWVDNLKRFYGSWLRSWKDLIGDMGDAWDKGNIDGRLKRVLDQAEQARRSAEAAQRAAEFVGPPDELVSSTSFMDPLLQSLNRVATMKRYLQTDFTHAKPVSQKTVGVEEDAEKVSRMRRAAEELASTYRQLVGSGRLASGELQRVWDAYVEARRKQIGLEVAGMKELGLSTQQMTDFIAAKNEELDREISGGPRALGNKLLDERVSAMEEIASSGVLSIAKLQGAWTDYEDLRAEQIRNEVAALSVSGAEAAQLLANRLAVLRKQVREAIAEPVREMIDQQVGAYEEIVRSGVLSAAEVKSAWTEYAKARADQIVAEAQSMRDLGVSAETVAALIETRFRQLRGDEIAATGSALEKWATELPQKMRDSFETLFFDAMTQDFKNLREYADSVFRDIAEMMSRLAAQELEKKVTGGKGFESLVGGLMSSTQAPAYESFPGAYTELPMDLQPVTQYRAPQIEGGGGPQSAGPTVTIQVQTPDARSFLSSSQQIASRYGVAIAEAQRRNF